MLDLVPKYVLERGFAARFSLFQFTCQETSVNLEKMLQYARLVTRVQKVYKFLTQLAVTTLCIILIDICTNYPDKNANFGSTKGWEISVKMPQINLPWKPPSRSRWSTHFPLSQRYGWVKMHHSSRKRKNINKHRWYKRCYCVDGRRYSIMQKLP